MLSPELLLLLGQLEKRPVKSSGQRQLLEELRFLDTFVDVKNVFLQKGVLLEAVGGNPGYCRVCGCAL